MALDWRFRGPAALEPVVEVASVHGQSEHPAVPGAVPRSVPGTFAHDQLRAGRRFGMIGSTDGHDGHPGLAHLLGGRGGLAAILAAERTRDGVYRALRAHRTYATNGPRIVLRAALEAGGLSVRVAGTAPLERVELVGPEGVVDSQPGEGSLLHHVFALPEEPREEPGDAWFAYVRVVQADGGMAWSSPIYTPSPHDQRQNGN